MLNIGSIIDGKYRVLSELGQGGVSHVYLVINERANKTWALKELKKSASTDPDSLQKGLLAETDILKSLDHKYLPAIADIIDHEDGCLILMDYIQGKSLDKVLKNHLKTKGRPLAPEDVLHWAKELCQVLYYLHSRPKPIIYRDLKPSNIMLKPDGDICLIDFGTAYTCKEKRSGDTLCLGTPGYAAPEQYGSGPVTEKSDIYCLGATLHHLLTGQDPGEHPFHFLPITSSRPALLNEIPTNKKNMLLGLEIILQKCTCYEAEGRYKSCKELYYDLTHAEELALPYKKAMRKRAVICGLFCSLTFLSALAFTGSRLLAARTKARGHEALYSMAQKEGDTKRKLEDLMASIRLEPTDIEPYLAYLDVIGSRGDYDAAVTSFLQERVDGQMLWEILEKREPVKYAVLSYKVAYTYFFMDALLEEGEADACDARSCKAAAKPYFETVARACLTEEKLSELKLSSSGGRLSEDDLGRYDIRPELVESCYRICLYYDSFGKEDPVTGEEVHSFREYFSLLEDLLKSQGETAEKDTSALVRQLRVLKTVCGEVDLHKKEFKDAGVKKESFEKLFETIEAISYAAETGDHPLAEQLRGEIKKELPFLKLSLESLYEK